MGRGPSYVYQEFPLYQMGLRMIQFFSGTELIIAARIFSFGSWFIFLLILAGVLKSLYGIQIMLPAWFFTATTTLCLLPSTSIQPDMLMLMFYAASFYFFQRWMLEPANKWQVMGYYLCVILSVLAKFYAIFFYLVPFFYILLKNLNRKRQWALHLMSMLMTTAIPVICWIMHAKIVLKDHPNSFENISRYAEWFQFHWFIPSENFNLYSTFLKTAVFNFATISPVYVLIPLSALIAAALYRLMVPSRHMAATLYLYSLIVYYMVFNFLVATHYYYWLPMLIPLSVGIGSMMVSIHKRPVFWWLVILGVAINSWWNIFFISRYYHTDESSYHEARSGMVLKNLLPPDSLVLCASSEQMTLLYYSEQDGYDIDLNFQRQNSYASIFSREALNPDTYILEELKKKISLGITHLAIIDLVSLSQSEVVIDYLMTNFPVVYFKPEEMIVFQIQAESDKS